MRVDPAFIIFITDERDPDENDDFLKPKKHSFLFIKSRRKVPGTPCLYELFYIFDEFKIIRTNERIDRKNQCRV